MKKNMIISNKTFAGVLGKLLLFFIFFYLVIDKEKAQATTPELLLAARKTLTPAVSSIDSSKPLYFSNTNNLRRKTASPFLAKGTYLTIEGYVTDLLGTPLENVNVKIWHANQFGYYNHLANQDDDEQYDPDFNGSGWTVTDNLGYYSFITIMPGYYGNRTPHVHFLLEGEYFGLFETEMIFPYSELTSKDPKIMSLSDNNINNITCKLELLSSEEEERGKRALFNIKLDVIHPLKRY